MKRYWLLALAIATAFLALFAIASAFDVDVLSDPVPALRRSGAAGAIGVALLVADVLLPIPSSLVMVALGSIHGVVWGALLAWMGGVGASALAFACGRKGSRVVARLVSTAEKQRADAWLDRWGATAIVLTRPVPLLAETVAILAGASALRWRTLLAAAAAGAAPPAIVYAAIGAYMPGADGALVSFALVLLASAVPSWLARRK